jgi:hypothetical protein
MGKAILIVVLGFSAITTVMIMNLNANSNKGLETTVEFYKDTQARLIANSGIEIYLEKLRRDKSLTGNFLNNSLMNGEYDNYIWGPDSALNIKTVARFNGVNHTSVVTARRRPMNVPNVNSSLYISTSSMSLNLNGNVNIDGNDNNMNGSEGPQSPLPGIGVDKPSDSAFVLNNVKPKISGDIDGYGGPPSIYTVENNISWLDATDDFIFSADTVLSTGTYTTGSQFGTLDKPIITYCTGDVTFRDATGYGIMVVNGNIKLDGNFKFYGILIVYGDSQIEVRTAGNNSVYGSTICVGNSVDIVSTGNANFLYSSQAIANAQLKLKSSRFEILSWWE